MAEREGFESAWKRKFNTLALYPESPVDHHNLGTCYEQKRMYSEAVAEYLKGDEFEGANDEELRLKRHIFEKSGLRGYLEHEVQTDVAEEKQHYIPAFDFANLYARLGDKDRAFASLERVFKERGHNLAFIQVEPGLDSLRSDPRYSNLLRRMGLPLQ